MAELSAVQICNFALGHIGADSTIESLSEQSPEATACNLWYEWSRRQTLEAYDWSFGRTRTSLALLETISDTATDPAYYEWVYRYQYPADCLVMRKISNPNGTADDAVPFEVETSEGKDSRTIFTNMEDAIGVYTFNCDKPYMFSAHFADTLAVMIAYRIAFSMTGKASIAQSMLELYQAMLRAAPAVDANERMGAPPRDADWIRNR